MFYRLENAGLKHGEGAVYADRKRQREVEGIGCVYIGGIVTLASVLARHGTKVREHDK